MSTTPQVRLQIPRPLYSAFASFLQLPAESFDKLVTTISNIEPTLSADDFAERVSAKVSIDPSIVSDLISMVVSLYSLRTELKLSVPDLVNAVYRALIETSDERLKSSNNNWDGFKERLTTLLNSDRSIGLVSRLNDLRTQQQRVFHDARILTDVRPLLVVDGSGSSDVGVIVHQLKITYHEDTGIKEFFVALDLKDLRELGSLVEQAELEARALKEKLVGSLLIVGVDEE